MRPVEGVGRCQKPQGQAAVYVSERICETSLEILHMHAIPFCVETIHRLCLPEESYAPGSLERLPPYSRLPPAGTQSALSRGCRAEVQAECWMEYPARTSVLHHRACGAFRGSASEWLEADKIIFFCPPDISEEESCCSHSLRRSAVTHAVLLYQLR